jgi:hypothetical protein
MGRLWSCFLFLFLVSWFPYDFCDGSVFLLLFLSLSHSSSPSDPAVQSKEIRTGGFLCAGSAAGSVRLKYGNDMEAGGH